MQKKIVERSLKQQKSLLKQLAARSNVSPQNVYKSSTSSVQHKLIFLARTTPNIKDPLKECEISINDELLPNLLKNPAYNQKYRNIYSLPIREVGLNIFKPQDRFKENETVKSTVLIFEAELKQQQIIQEIKKESLLSTQKRRKLKAKTIRMRFAHLT